MGRQQNIQLLRMAAATLKPLLEDLVFVGGCTTALLITDEAAADVRVTYDVDVVAELSSYAEYTKLSEQLRELGLKEDQSEGAPMCRWRADELILDVMPDDESVLGFTNKWYQDVLRTAQRYKINDDAEDSSRDRAIFHRHETRGI